MTKLLVAVPLGTQCRVGTQHGLEAGFGIRHHRPELEEAKGCTPAPDALLPEQDRCARQPDQHCDDGHERRKQDQENACAEDVGETLERVGRRPALAGVRLGRIRVADEDKPRRRIGPGRNLGRTGLGKVHTARRHHVQPRLATTL